MTRIVLHIDRLVLRGVDPADAQAVRSALQAELGTLLAAAGPHTPWHTGAVRLRPPAVPLPAGADARALGRAVAGAVAGTAGPGTAGPMATAPRIAPHGGTG